MCVGELRQRKAVCGTQEGRRERGRAEEEEGKKEEEKERIRWRWRDERPQRSNTEKYLHCGTQEVESNYERSFTYNAVCFIEVLVLYLSI